MWAIYAAQRPTGGQGRGGADLAPARSSPSRKSVPVWESKWGKDFVSFDFFTKSVEDEDEDLHSEDSVAYNLFSPSHRSRINPLSAGTSPVPMESGFRPLSSVTYLAGIISWIFRRTPARNRCGRTPSCVGRCVGRKTPRWGLPRWFQVELPREVC